MVGVKPWFPTAYPQHNNRGEASVVSATAFVHKFRFPGVAENVASGKGNGLNSFAGTLLFGGAILALAGAPPVPAEALSPASSQRQPI